MIHSKLVFLLIILIVATRLAVATEPIDAGSTGRMPEEHPAAEPAHVQSVMDARQFALKGASLQVGSNVDRWEDTFPKETIFVSCSTSTADCNAKAMQRTLVKDDPAPEKKPRLLGQMLEKRVDGTSWLHFGFEEPAE